MSHARAGEAERRFPSRPVLAVSLAVFRDGRVLLAQRAAAPFAGRYTLPGGGVEAGETMAEAALREMREEVGVEARIVAFNRHVEIIERDGSGVVQYHYVIASHVGAWVSGEGTPGPEARAITWATRDEAATLPTTEHLAPLLDGAWRIFERTSQAC